MSRRAGRTSVARLSTAGRLLLAIEGGGAPLAELARLTGVREQTLLECRDGIRPLEPAVQMKLAAGALIVAPEHERLARTLYAQAQAALRLEESGAVRHLTYPKERFT